MGSKTTHRRAKMQQFDKLLKPLDQYCHKGEAFLRHFVTGDEHGSTNMSQSKCQAMEWKHLALSVKSNLECSHY
jgi:hypothetical protein